MKDKAVTLLTEVFPDRAHIIETVGYFARDWKAAAPTVNKVRGLPTVQNLSEV